MIYISASKGGNPQKETFFEITYTYLSSTYVLDPSVCQFSLALNTVRTSCLKVCSYIILFSLLRSSWWCLHAPSESVCLTSFFLQPSQIMFILLRWLQPLFPSIPLLLVCWCPAQQVHNVIVSTAFCCFILNDIFCLYDTPWCIITKCFTVIYLPNIQIQQCIL